MPQPAKRQALLTQIRAVHKRYKDRLSEQSADTAGLAHAMRGSCLQDGPAQLNRKSFAYAAHFYNALELLAIIEFIESLKVLKDGDEGTKTDIRTTLSQRHANLLRSVERETADMIGRLAALSKSCQQAREYGRRVNVASFADPWSNANTRLLKDIAVLNWLHKIGVTSRITTRSDL